MTTPHLIGRYRIDRELGRGTMGIVYEAHDTMLDRTVALKTINIQLGGPAPDDSFQQRFINEARAVAKLSHPNIVTVHDVGRDGHTFFIAFEHLRGRTLSQIILADGVMPWREAARIAARLAEALHAAHNAGILHRDMKPENVMLLPSGEPKIMDFGIAKLPMSKLTASGEIFGTPAYMAPEQALGETLDARSDLFSLGTVLYELVAGVPAFHGPKITAIMAQVIERDPPPPSHWESSVPPDLDRILRRLLAKPRERRYADGHSVAEDLQDLIAGREPRNLFAWDPPAPASGTVADIPEIDLGAALPTVLMEPIVVGAGAPSPKPPPPPPVRAGTLEQDELRPAAPPTRQGSRRALLLGILGVLAIGAVLIGGTVLMLMRARARTTERPAMPPAVASPLTSATLARARPAPTTLAPPVEPAGLVESPAPVLRHTPWPRPAVSPRVATTAATPAPAPVAAPAALTRLSSLAVHVEHPLKGGTLLVWVDGRRVLQEPLQPAGFRRVGGVPIALGVADHRVAVAAGPHAVRVELQWPGDTRTASLQGSFAAGATMTLDVRLPRAGQELSARWR